MIDKIDAEIERIEKLNSNRDTFELVEGLIKLESLQECRKWAEEEKEKTDKREKQLIEYNQAQANRIKELEEQLENLNGIVKRAFNGKTKEEE